MRIDVSFVMPCLNEEATIGACIAEAKSFLKRRKLNGEIIVVDNNCTDKSAEIAKKNGAIVVKEKAPGYGSALRAGFKKAKGKRIIMGDCDLTYDFANADNLYDTLDKCDFAIGNRFGGIEKGAMPLSHWFGVKGLSMIARLRYRVDVRDFHCGIRAFRRDILKKVDYRTTGMEFATEMIGECARVNLSIGQVPVVLRKSVKGRRPKLNTIRDGFRHLRYIVLN